MINKSGIDSSVINQAVNGIELNRNTVNSQRLDVTKQSNIDNVNNETDTTSSNKILAVDEVKASEEAKETEENADTLEQAFNVVSEFINVYNRNVSFSKDNESDTTVIQVFDSDTKELIKQFPSADLVELANKISELNKDLDLQSGVFFDEKV